MGESVARGAVLIVAGMALIGLIDNLVRVVAAEIGLWQFHALRSAIALPVLALLIWGCRLRARMVRPWAVWLRAGLMAGAMLVYFAALPMLPIAQVAAGLFTAPIFVLIYSVVFLRRRVGVRRLAAVGVGFAGVLMILRPEGAGFLALNLVPVAAGAIYGAATLVTRELCAEEPVAAMLGAFFAVLGACGVIGVAVVAALGLEGATFLTSALAWPSDGVWAVIWVQALGSLVAVGMLTRGYQSGETSYLTVFEYSFLVFSAFWGWSLWAQAIGMRDVAGMALIFAAGAVIAIRGARRDAHPDPV